MKNERLRKSLILMIVDVLEMKIFSRSLPIKFDFLGCEQGSEVSFDRLRKFDEVV